MQETFLKVLDKIENYEGEAENMVMRDREIKDRYVRKDVTIKILAELNACDEEDIRRILKKQGVDVPKKERKKRV